MQHFKNRTEKINILQLQNYFSKITKRTQNLFKSGI